MSYPHLLLHDAAISWLKEYCSFNTPTKNVNWMLGNISRLRENHKFSNLNLRLCHELLKLIKFQN